MNCELIQILLFSGVFFIALVLISPCKKIFQIAEIEGSRLSYLDGLRGIAALLVVACHINQHLLSFFKITQPPIIANNFGIVGVELFFALTAFLFTTRALKGNFNPAVFYLSRVKRIAPLYIFVASVSLAIIFLLPQVSIASWQNAVVDVISMVSFGFIGADSLIIEGFNAFAFIGIAWSLSYEWKFYLILPPLYYLFSHSRKASIAVIVLLLAIAFKDFYQNPHHTCIWSYFLVGVFAALLFPFIKNFKNTFKPFLAIIILLSIISAAFFPAFSLPQLVLIQISFLAILLCQPKILGSKPLVNLGQISYSIYLMQYLVMMPIIKTAKNLDIFSATAEMKFIFAFLIVVCLIPASCFTYQFIEQRWIKKEKELPASTMVAEGT
ncbi:acyltransferase (plasmid) [Legionella adelaidensis]|uniref:Acyltransferase n=1 Tax=Legionella adelaidensis TaxID=45056 RepID=A0A0W0R4M7_9GAMM|nr:acyltransferase [Legionella adelaidensis]KTC66031.1 O-antigen acetylase [Legionella adelaidensis]VEH85690.1 acyltransferase [Legionella adelaidensis]